MRKIILFFILLFSLAGCNRAEAFRVGVVMSGSRDDLSFNQSMVDALLKIQNERGIEQFSFDVSDNIKDEGGWQTAVSTYATQEYDLIILHGLQNGEIVQKIAPDFPQTSFAWGSTSETAALENVFTYQVAADEGGYINGALAAILSQSGTVGVIAPNKFEEASRYIDGFTAGAKATNPEIEVLVNNVGASTNDTFAAEAAQAHIDAGADVLSGTTVTAVDAINVVQENDALWFGTQIDQSTLAPDIVVANQVYDWTVALDEMIALIETGTVGGDSFTIQLENSGLLMRYNPEFPLPNPIRQLADEMMFNIIDGLLETKE